VAQQLSKSDYLKYLICPSYLWLWKNKPETVPTDEEETIKARLEQGNEIERYARLLFPEGKLVETRGLAAKADTERLVSDGTKTIFQATVITDDGLLAMADIITRDDASESWTLYEVKSTNSIKKEHILDLSFQRVAFEDAGYTIGKVEVIYLNKDYRRRPQVVPKDLLMESDVTSEVAELIEIVRAQTQDALKYLNLTDEPSGCSCRLNSRSKHCPTFHYLNPDIPEYSVFNISRINGKKLALLIDNDIVNVHDVPEDIKLSVIQQNQVDAEKSKQPKIDKAAIAAILNELEFPLYFLDYETVSTALPLYGDCKPYQQIPFQYSLHVLREPNGTLEHYEYLSHDSTTLPAHELLSNLKQQIGPTGSVITWNKSFEMGRNREMAAQYPEFTELMEGINNRVFDLMEIFSKQHYVHHKFKGSSSIKKVLPVIVDGFTYDDMDISNGQAAALRWYEAVTSDDTELANKTYESLLEYCKLDTLAMVEIYKTLKNV
jgi:CRISPR/Cas system-associated exonuclease Cas4 (RecB family)